MSRNRRRKKNRAGRISIACIVLFLLAVMSVQMVRLHAKNQTYMEKEAELKVQLEEETKRQEEISEYEKYIGSQAYVEDTAKSKLGLVYENDIIFKER